MSSKLFKYVFFFIAFCCIAELASAQKRKSTKKTTKGKTKANIQASVPTADTTAVVAAPPDTTKKDQVVTIDSFLFQKLSHHYVLTNQ